jgi:hypothetical protein
LKKTFNLISKDNTFKQIDRYIIARWLKHMFVYIWLSGDLQKVETYCQANDMALYVIYKDLQVLVVYDVTKYCGL